MTARSVPGRGSSLVKEPREIRCRGQKYRVIRQIRVRKKTYPILEELGHAGRQRYLVYDQDGGVNGDLRTIHVLPRARHTSRHTFQQLDVLTRVSESNFAVPTIMECHSERDRIIVITKWIPGVDLATFLDDAEHGHTDWPSPFMAFTLFRKFVHGLCQFHHYKDCVHGDLKPANLILCQQPYQLVMIDFGSAWLEEETRRREPGDGTTPWYAAPELHRPNATLDFRCDQYSATAVFFELLTGEVPYQEMGRNAGWDEHRSGLASTFVRPSKARGEREGLPSPVWRKIDQLVKRGLELDPDKRFPNGRVWRDALDDIQCDLRRSRQLGSAHEFVLSVIDWFYDRFNPP